jgi:hypothetical protein
MSGRIVGMLGSTCLTLPVLPADVDGVSKLYLNTQHAWLSYAWLAYSNQRQFGCREVLVSNITTPMGGSVRFLASLTCKPVMYQCSVVLLLTTA